MEMGARLRKFRLAKNLSVAEIARRIKVSESTYRDWENGRAIKGEPYIKLASVFDVSLDELFGQNMSNQIFDTTASSEIELIQRSLNRLRDLVK